MASAHRLARVLSLMVLWEPAGWASNTPTPAPQVALPTDYSLSYDKDRWTDGFSVFHMAVADPLGIFGSGFAASADSRLRPLTRLDSSWNLTAPLLALPLRIGDGISSAGLWDQPARIGGIQLGSAPITPPDVVAPPTTMAQQVTMAQQATMVQPATMAQPATRFIEHLRSLMQFQNLPLTPAGHADFSVEAGRLRQNFEMRSNDYGPWIASGSYRYGVTAATTVAGQVAQVAGQKSVIGVGVMTGLGPAGLVSANLASSRDADSSGWLARMGYDYSHEYLSVALRSHIQSLRFQEVGDYSSIEPLRQRTLASARVDLGWLGKFSLASATQTSTDDSRRDIIAVSHAMPFCGGGILSAAAAYSPGQVGSSAVLVSFTYPFDYAVRPAHKMNTAVNGALDRTIVDAFGQTRLPTSGRPPTDKLFQD